VSAQALACLLTRWVAHATTDGADDDDRGPSWHDAGRTPPLQVAAVRATDDGFLALLTGGASSVVLASLGGGPSAALPVVARCAELAGGDATDIDAAALQEALAALAAWRADAADRATAGLEPDVAEPPSAPAVGRRRVTARIAAIMRAAPPHRRPLLSALAERARAVIARPGGAGLDRALGVLATSTHLADEGWLAAVAELATPTRPASSPADELLHPIALLLLQRGPRG